jgi:hypothetical protein
MKHITDEQLALLERDAAAIESRLIDAQAVTVRQYDPALQAYLRSALNHVATLRTQLARIAEGPNGS